MHPIVSLDKIYIKPYEENIYFLDCTRVDKTNNIISRKEESLPFQITRLSSILKNKQIVLADDVVFSGSVLKTIIEMFEKEKVEVIGIIASVCTNESYEYFNSNLKDGLKSNYKMSDEVIDQICERDFYFGIAGSGIMKKIGNSYYKAPYFLPYGNPNERASIPKEYEKEFSKGCLERSIYLWEEMDRSKKRKTTIGELPERIINTNSEEEVVKTLKKELGNL